MAGGQVFLQAGGAYVLLESCLLFVAALLLCFVAVGTLKHGALYFMVAGCLSALCICRNSGILDSTAAAAFVYFFLVLLFSLLFLVHVPVPSNQ